MKFSWRLSGTCLARRLHSYWFQVRFVLRYILWHGCWCSFLVGAVILAVGIILRSPLVKAPNAKLVSGTGIFFIIIGLLLLVASPMLALCELIYNKRLKRYVNAQNRGGHGVETGESRVTAHRTESTNRPMGSSGEVASDLPSYDDIDKTSRPVLYTTHFPRPLDVDSLSTSSRSPPAYNEIVRTGSMYSHTSESGSSEERHQEQIATIEPSSQIVQGKVSNQV